MKINGKYKSLFNIPENVRYFIITGGRGSSKSFSVQTAITYHADTTNRKFLLTRETMTSAHLSIIPEFQDKIDVLNLNNRFNSNKTEITNIASGAKIIFKGLTSSSGDQTAQLKSLQEISMWVVDEAEELMNEAKFDKIDLSIRSNKHQNIVVLILNPTSKEHWIHKRFFETKGIEHGFNGTSDNICYIHTTYLDNIENLPVAYVKQLERIKEVDPIKFNHIVMGGWLDKAEGVIFTNWKYGEFDNSLPYIFGMDFGFSNDPDTLVKVAIDNKRMKLYVKCLIYRNGLGTNQLAELINGSEAKGKAIIGDSSEPRLIHDLASNRVNITPVHKFAGSVFSGIKMMRNYEIIVEQESTDIGKELNNYVWANKSKEIPVDLYNHAIDAIRYAVQTALNHSIQQVY